MLENVPSKALFIRLSEGTVAPFTGAWIETLAKDPLSAIQKRRTHEGCNYKITDQTPFRLMLISCRPILLGNKCCFDETYCYY